MNNKINFHSTDDIEKMLPRINDILFLRLSRDSRLTYLITLLIGILNRTYELVETSIWSIKNDRPITAATAIRSLYETLGYITYIEMEASKSSDNDRKKIIENALLGSRDSENPYNQISILTCLDKASKIFPDLRKSYDKVCEVVHPNSASHFAPFHAVNGGSREVKLVLPRYEFKNNDKMIFTNHAGECCHHIIAISERLIKIS